MARRWSEFRVFEDDSYEHRAKRDIKSFTEMSNGIEPKIREKRKNIASRTFLLVIRNLVLKMKRFQNLAAKDRFETLEITKIKAIYDCLRGDPIFDEMEHISSRIGSSK